jgi:hypothetical protein
MAVEVFVCNECCMFDITLCSHFIKILFYNINLMDTESVGTCGMDGLLVDTEYQVDYCVLGSCCAGNNMMTILASVCARIVTVFS